MVDALHDPAREARELREQLSSDRRRLGFLFGAGTSQAVGIDGIVQLTSSVVDTLSEPLQGHSRRLLAELGEASTIEDVLNLVRLCRELLRGQDTAAARGLTLEQAAALDGAICRGIYERVQINPPGGLAPHTSFAQWLRSVDRTHPPEVFTTNYDLLIERALEECDVPHFDGFIGTVEPRFSAASVEAEPTAPWDRICPPAGWIRVWKLHGSTNWRLYSGDGTQFLARSHQAPSDASAELMIFPSHNKYAESRKVPFLTLQDRLRRFLTSGEGLFVTCGYSFSDQHINEIIFEALRWNHRLAVTALMFGDYHAPTQRHLVERARDLRNFTVHFSDSASVGGRHASWGRPSPAPSNLGSKWPFWDSTSDKYTLGDFRHFCEYLRLFLGAPEAGPRTGAPQRDETPVLSGGVAAADAPLIELSSGNGQTELTAAESLPS